MAKCRVISGGPPLSTIEVNYGQGYLLGSDHRHRSWSHRHGDRDYQVLMISKFWLYGIKGNVWFLFHCAAGLVLYLIACAFIPKRKHYRALITVLLLALGWEVFEYLHDDVLTVYGSYERWAYDSAGDVLGAVAVAAILMLGGI
jgi:hypothetical protein